MEGVPWKLVQAGGDRPMHTDGRARIRVYDAWTQSRQLREKTWSDIDQHTLLEWSKFFELLGCGEDVTSFEARCAALGGVEQYKDAFDECGFRALHVCAALGLTGIAAVLLRHGYDGEIECVHDQKIGIWDEVSEVITSAVRPLHIAAKYGQDGMITLLLDHGVDVHSMATTCHGELAKKVNSVQIAALEGRLSAAKLLVEHGADVLEEGCYGCAESCGGPSFARILMELGHILKAKSIHAMLSRVAGRTWTRRPREEVVQAVEEVLELMADLRVKPLKTCLAAFVRNGSIRRDAMLEIVLLLVLHGASVANENGPLLMAAFQGNVPMIRLMFMLGWNAGGSVEALGKISGGRAMQGLARDAVVMQRVPNFAARSQARQNRAADLLADAATQVPSLQVWCRWSILAAIQDPRKVSQLPIAPMMKSFILLANERHELLSHSAKT